MGLGIMNFASTGSGLSLIPHSAFRIRFSTSIGASTSIIGICICVSTEYTGNSGLGSVSVQTFIRTWLCLETVFVSPRCFIVLGGALHGLVAG